MKLLLIYCMKVFQKILCLCLELEVAEAKTTKLFSNLF